MSANGKKWSQFAEATSLVDGDKLLVRDVSEAAGSQIKEMTKANFSTSMGLAGHLADASLHMPKDDINARQLSKAPANAAVLNGSTSVLSNADASDLLVGGDGTTDNQIFVRAVIKIRSLANAFPIAGRYDSGKPEWLAEVDTSGFLKFRAYDHSGLILITATANTLALSVGQECLVDFVYDGTGGATAMDGVTLRVNSVDCGITKVNHSSYVAMEDKGGSFRVGENNAGSYHADGEIYGFVVGNTDMGGNGEFDLVVPPEYQWGGPISYTSDFSGGVNGWTANQGTAAGNIDAIGGEDDTLRFTIDTVNSASHWLQRSGLTAGKWYEIKFDYYIPSTNSHVDGLGFLDTLTEIDADDAPATDTWVTKTLRFKAASSLFRVRTKDGGATTMQDAGGDDVFYIKNFTWRPLGALVSYQGRNILPTGNVNDESSNGLHLAGTSVTPLFRPTGGQFSEEFELAHGSISSSAATTELISLPKGCRILGIETIVDTAFDGSTTLSIGITGTAAKYVNALDVASTGRNYNASSAASESDTSDTSIYVQKNQATTLGSAKFRVIYEITNPTA